jgi:hypothetical protein
VVHGGRLDHPRVAERILRFFHAAPKARGAGFVAGGEGDDERR